MKIRCTQMKWACVIWLCGPLVYNGIRQLVPDEAYYWVWSRHLSGGYLDHPPMVAWMIRAGTTLFGTSEFSVRFFAAVLTMGTILMVMGLARDRSAAWILLLSPFTAVLGTIITPDTPACFFGVCALASAVAACRTSASSVEPRHGAWWIVFGVCMGLALDSKYTMVLLGAAVGLALLSTPDGRRHLFSAPFALGLLAALGIFWPVISWNRAHDWASFRFQWHHGAGDDPSASILNLPFYIISQGAIFTPILFVMGIAALIWQWRQARSLDAAQRIILLSATLPLVFFGIFSVRHRPEPNWPIFAYLPLTIILSRWLAQCPPMRWTRIGLIVAAVAMVIGHLPEIVELVPVRLMANIPNPWEEMFGWREMGTALDQRSAGATVYCTSYENASEAAFYMAGRPSVWTIDTDRPTAFDFFPGRPDPASLEKVVCVTRVGSDVPLALKSFSWLAVEPWHASALGRRVRPRQLIVAER
jgi:4-amino-4-deoxy-L-arabinose transferase-like glycosyltransferase